jgi:uncharacterized membrane protein YhaH (DUF805 family)
MNFPQAIASGFRKYATFSGRASRAEYWYWALFVALGRYAARMLDAGLLSGNWRLPGYGETFALNAPLFGQMHIFTTIFLLAVTLPGLAVAVRRLHDVDRSGWWLLSYLTIIGILYPLLVWKCRRGTVGPNRFGHDPLGMEWVVAQFE